MEKQRTNLGARVLSNQELNMILPNANSVFEQIEVFRKNIVDMEDKWGQEPDQKTNNIGIIGCRGAGKTSILKTFKELLRKKNIEIGENSGNSKDILLPLIVPENMSSSSTLMDVVLGMLKSEVDEIKRKTERGRKDCIYSGRNSLEKEYNELVKQYCYIKKDYRDILIQQFTTEQNYVDKTKEVFNSDTEFISLFRQFVEHLLQENDRDGGRNSNALLFLFIDDIDLSTTRCMDVVKTLLSYLSLPRIVTFISGDIETFEEALTLDFLRQENALDEGILEETYYSTIDESGSTLLERKKMLAYEYLKKIIPPAYRKRIKYWSLDERGYYQIIGDREKKQKNLAELLIEVTKSKIDRSYFSYEENGQLKYMNPVFHMLDVTSRSLNNVYNVLQEIYEQDKGELLLRQGNIDSEEFVNPRKIARNWRLIETLVDSKPLYSKYKEQLLQKIIIFEQEQVRIDFESADRFLYGKENVQQGTMKEGSSEKNKTSKNEIKEKAEKFSAEEKFSMFVLIDFSLQLFGTNKNDKEAYTNLKNKIIGEYISDEAIDGKIAIPRETLNLQKKMSMTTDVKQKGSVVKMILNNLLYYGDFIFALYVIRYLGRDKVYDIFNKTEKTDSEQIDIYNVSYALARTLDAICGSTEKKRECLADLYDRTPQTMLALLNNISSDPWIIFAEQLVPETFIPISKWYFDLESPKDTQFFWIMADKNLENIENYIFEAKNKQNIQDYFWAVRENTEFLYWVYYEKLKEERGDVFDIKEMTRKLMYKGFKNTTMRRLTGTVINNQYEVKGLEEMEYNLSSSGNTEQEKKRMNKHQAIVLIDENGLWKDEYVKTNVNRYLEKEIRKYIQKIEQDFLIFDAGDLVKKSYRQLEDCDKGSSGKALICELWNKINAVMKLEFESLDEDSGKQNKSENYYMGLNHVLILQCLLEGFLNKHARIRYGKKEARQFLADLKELPLVIFPTGLKTTVVRNMQTGETKGLKNLENQFLNEVKTCLGSAELLNSVVKESHERYYGDKQENHETLKDIVINMLRAKTVIPNAITCYYIMYLVQKKEIKKLIEKYSLNNRPVETLFNNSNISVLEQDYNFVFHSYLRYLQANESDAAKAGTEATAIAALAIDLLESESVADTRMIGNIYEKVGKQMNLTEDEFGDLFSDR